ncbi:MAG: class IV adenylate cyclase [Bariatricus sp.]
MDHFEIEIKMPVEDLNGLKRRLLRKGFQEEVTIRENDMYYNSEYHDVKKLGEALRIRKSTDVATGQTKAQINFKGEKIDQVSMSRLEYETGVDNPEYMDKILRALGFFQVAGVTKTRCYMKRDEMTACLDQVEGLGDFLELEVIVADESLREGYLQMMEGLLAELGLSMRDTVRTSYLSMLAGEIG